MIPNRKWSSDCKWSPKWTGNDLGPQLIPIVDGKDPLKSRGMEWISGMDDECAENLNNAKNSEMNKTINNWTVSFGNFSPFLSQAFDVSLLWKFIRIRKGRQEGNLSFI